MTTINARLTGVDCKRIIVSAERIIANAKDTSACGEASHTIDGMRQVVDECKALLRHAERILADIES